MRSIFVHCKGRLAVHALGQQTRGVVSTVLARSNQVIFPAASVNKAWPLVDATALKHVVGATDSRLPEVVEDGTTGWLAPADDPLALVDEVVRRLPDSDAVAWAGDLARQQALGRWPAAARCARAVPTASNGKAPAGRDSRGMSRR
jgi:hypothetical protein